ncbi:MAG: hypothetical protein RJQ09_12155 [Cyclobacteriaceae bacterium]
MRKNKKVTVPLIMMMVISGSLASNSELQNVRTIDILQLVVLGMTIGALVSGIIASNRGDQDR